MRRAMQGKGEEGVRRASPGRVLLTSKSADEHAGESSSSPTPWNCERAERGGEDAGVSGATKGGWGVGEEERDTPKEGVRQVKVLWLARRLPFVVLLNRAGCC